MEESKTLAKKEEPNVLAYMAGFFDGEGWIYIVKTKPYKLRRMISNRYYLYVGIGNTNQEIIEWIKDRVGGNILSEVGKNGLMYRWHLASIKAKDFLEKILPYLKIKKPQAILAIDFQNKCGGYVGRKGLSKEQINTREFYRSKIKEAKNEYLKFTRKKN